MRGDDRERAPRPLAVALDAVVLEERPILGREDGADEMRGHTIQRDDLAALARELRDELAVRRIDLGDQIRLPLLEPRDGRQLGAEPLVDTEERPDAETHEEDRDQGEDVPSAPEARMTRRLAHDA